MDIGDSQKRFAIHTISAQTLRGQFGCVGDAWNVTFGGRAEQTQGLPSPNLIQRMHEIDSTSLNPKILQHNGTQSSREELLRIGMGWVLRGWPRPKTWFVCC